MAFKHGKNSRFYWHDTNLTPWVERIEAEFTRSAGEARPLGSESVARVPSRLKDMRVSLQGLYDGSEGALEPFTWDRLNESAPRVFAYLPHGDGLGETAYCGLSDMASQSITAGDDVIRMPVAIVATTHADRCHVLCPLGHKEADGEGATVDDGLPTANGGAGYLLCTEIDAATTALVKIQHSVDGSAWDDLLSFTVLADIGSEAMVVPEGTTVRRYLRATWDLSGGHATLFVAFGRR